MTAANTAQPVNTVVPSAQPERQRIWQSDSFGIVLYVALAGAFLLVALIIVGWAR
jgi:hypothetical protein